MPLDGTSSASVCVFADRVDRLATEAHEVGLGHAAAVLVNMANLLRSLSGEDEVAAPSMIEFAEPLVAG